MQVKGNNKVSRWLREVIEINNLIELAYTMSVEQGDKTREHQTPFIKSRFNKIIKVLEIKE